MSLPILRYPLDPTGVNIDNLVSDEIHGLSSRSTRALVPKYSPFFSESVKVIDNVTRTALKRGVDFQCVELLQEATLQYGKEISQVILIINPTVSANVLVTYQALGGLYQFDMSAVANMYDTLMVDHRPVEWRNVLSKPSTFPPSLHNHILDDVYGWEYLIGALERIRNAIILSDVPAFEAVIDYINARVPDVVTFEEIDTRNPVKKMVTFDKLLYFMDTLDYCKLEITASPSSYRIRNQQNLLVNVELSCNPSSSGFYWTIEHVDTIFGDFKRLNGPITITNKRGSFIVPIGDAIGPHGADKKFKLQIRRNSIISSISVTSNPITIKGLDKEEAMIDYMNSCCLYNPRTTMNATSMFITGENSCREN